MRLENIDDFENDEINSGIFESPVPLLPERRRESQKIARFIEVNDRDYSYEPEVVNVRLSKRINNYNLNK